MLSQDKTPNGGNTPADNGFSQNFGSYMNREGKS